MERWMQPRVGDVLVMPDGVRREVVEVEFFVTYTYVNAVGAHQKVRARKSTWLPTGRAALREGGSYVPVESKPDQGDRLTEEVAR